MTARQKYNAKPTVIDGIHFASKKEAARYGLLKMLQSGGVIRNLELQPKFTFEVNGRPVLIRSEGYPNGRRASFRADFAYVDIASGETIVEDVKGGKATLTEASQLRRALVEAQFGVVVRTV